MEINKVGYEQIADFINYLHQHDIKPDTIEQCLGLLKRILTGALEAAGKALLVSDVIYANDIGSPATLHRRISHQEKQDLIRFNADIDGRKNVSS